MTLKERIDAIAFELADYLFLPEDAELCAKAIKAGIRAALEEGPSEEMKDIGCRVAEGPGWLEAYRAMIAVRLKELE